MHIMQNNQNPDGFKSESGIFKGLFLLLWNKGFECFLAIFFFFKIVKDFEVGSSNFVGITKKFA